MRSSKKTQKNQSSILGWIDRSHRRRFFQVIPFQKDFYGSIFLRSDDVKNHDVGLHNIVRVSLSRAKERNYEGRIQEVFESMDDPRVELAIVQEIHGFPIEFSDKALEDVERVKDQKPGKRIDLTRTVTVTIDGETAKDFDDAICVYRTKEGNYNLKVSIADVSAFVPEGTTLDKEAYDRATSIYFPNLAIPMLPNALSTDLCSLVPHQDRFTLTCEVELDDKGKVLKKKVYPSVIHSKARLTYTKVSDYLEHGKKGAIEPEIGEMLKTAHELSLLVRKNRTDRGGLDLDLPETELDIAASGEVTKVFRAERNEAHKLIEDFMILANECVSELIEEAGYASVFRVHADPDPLKIERLQKVIKHWGFKISDKKDLITSLQSYLDSVRGHKDEKILVVSLLRSLKQAEYSATNVGHFGLGSESYTHFTSPIRRYPDLIVHRLLRKSNFLKNPKEPYPQDKLQEMSQHCSEMERKAFLAERDMEDIKKARFMEQFVGKQFDGVITSVKSFGVFVEILPHYVEGLVPTRTLPNDYWNVDELETMLSGGRSKLAFWLGDRIRIQVAEVDRLKRQITFRYVQHIKDKP